MNSVSIVLLDDHHLVRQGLRALLSSEPGFSVVGEGSGGLEAADLVERHQPDVLIADMVMPGLNGVEVAKQVSQRWPRTRVLVLSMYANEAYILAALRGGASGYVLKTATPEVLAEAVRAVAAGRRYLCPPLTERAIDAYVHSGETNLPDAYETLTLREREVLHLAVEGSNNTQIGARLGISPRTVETHREKIMQKLDLKTLPELVRFALKRGILPMDD